jgi:hypothetical protein
MKEELSETQLNDYIEQLNQLEAAINQVLDVEGETDFINNEFHSTVIAAKTSLYNLHQETQNQLQSFCAQLEELDREEKDNKVVFTIEDIMTQIIEVEDTVFEESIPDDMVHRILGHTSSAYLLLSYARDLIEETINGE